LEIPVPDHEAADEDAADEDAAGEVVGADDGAAGDQVSDLPNDLQTPTHLPKPAVGRLSLYFRELHRLAESGVLSVNSRELGQLVAVSPAVVRRDLSALGTIGRRGVGYSVTLLSERIGRVLGTGVQWRVILVGVGSLGDALLRYRGFERLGFRLIGAFDVDPHRIGTEIGGVRVRPGLELEGALQDLKPDLAILAVPAEKAAEVAGQLVSGGVTGILNFAPTTLRLSPRVAVVNVDLASELQRLAFSVQSQK
jgi:redox-sensing transcriptional repressor